MQRAVRREAVQGTRREDHGDREAGVRRLHERPPAGHGSGSCGSDRRDRWRSEACVHAATSGREGIMKFCFDMKLMRPGCVLLAAALGGDTELAKKFSTEIWLL